MGVRDLHVIAKTDPNGNRRQAAIRMLRSQEYTDIADFEEVIGGVKTLQQLRTKGVDTAVVKRISPKVLKIGNEERLVNEIELRDTSLEEQKELADRTGGRVAAAPDVLQKQAININVSIVELGKPPSQRISVMPIMPALPAESE